MSQKHYNISYLEDTARLMKDIKEQSYKPFAHITDGTIIDLGCGTGIDVVNMAQRLGEQVQVIGLDHDPEMIRKASAAKETVKNVDFLQSEATTLPFAEETLSGVRAERLFQHLKQPELVLAELMRVLQPGAPLTIVETDWNSLSFYSGETAVEKKMHDYLTDVKIVNGMAAKNLTQYLERQSFRNLKLEIVPLVLSSLQEAFDYLWTDRIIAEMVEKDYISAAEQKMFMEVLQVADAQSYFACSINIAIVSCLK